MLTGVIIVGLVNAVLLAYLIMRRPANIDSGAAHYLKTDLTELTRGISELKDSLNDKISDKLDKSQQHMNESIQRQFSQSAKIITEITQRLTKLD
ncbi:MAG TPA: hypothetical protein VM124_03375, partial [Candidatus Limnocylindrales bacterium]|nr:hypothetical protein [Candidatus Limnocylindrales bacterium]